MNYSLHSLFSILAAACAATIVSGLLSWLLNRRPSAARSLQDYAFSPTSAGPPDIAIGSQDHKIRLAFAGYGLVTGAATPGLPPLFWLGRSSPGSRSIAWSTASGTRCAWRWRLCCP
ncbi:MAG: hypothetical protein JXB15_16525 [Anaerolineales bacterium]|nr:hypothetical protein [Anaerolineales bacterium]